MARLSNIVSVCGHRLTVPEKYLLRKLEVKYDLVVGDLPVTVKNPFNCVTVDVVSVVATLIEFVQQTSYSENLTYNGVKVSVSDFDRVRYLIMKVDREAYHKILD